MTAAIKERIAGPCRNTLVRGRCVSCVLDTSDYFLDLGIEAKHALQEVLQYKNYPRRTRLYREDDMSEQLFILISGEVKIHKSLANGRQQIHKLAQIPGDLIACEDLFFDRYTSTAESITSIEVCVLHKNNLIDLMERFGEISNALIHSMARNLNAYISHIANLGQKSALEKVASYLVYLNVTHQERNLRSEVLVESLTRSELADMIGVTQRTLIRSLKELETRSVISLARDGFIIIDHASLEHLSEGQ